QTNRNELISFRRFPVIQGFAHLCHASGRGAIPSKRQKKQKRRDKTRPPKNQKYFCFKTPPLSTSTFSSTRPIQARPPRRFPSPLSQTGARPRGGRSRQSPQATNQKDDSP